MKAIVQERFRPPDVLQFVDSDLPQIGCSGPFADVSSYAVPDTGVILTRTSDSSISKCRVSRVRHLAH